MVTIENIQEHLEKNPKEKEIIMKQLEYFFPIWIDEKYKQDILKNLQNEDIEFILQAQLLSSVSIDEIKKCKNEEEFISIKQKLENIKNGENQILLDINKQYRQNFDNALKEYNDRVEKYKYEKLPANKKKQIDNLINSGNKDKAKIVIDNFYKNNIIKLNKLIDSLNKLTNAKDSINIMIFSSNVLKKNPDLIEKIAYVIYNPVALFNKEIEDILSDLFPLPGDWYLYRNLSRNDYTEFLNSISNGDGWNKQYNYTINRIKEKIKIPILPIVIRKNLLEDIITSLSNQRYDSSIIIMFTVIEGLLWEIAHEVNKNNNVFYSQSSIYDFKNKKEFESTRIRDVVERTYVSNYLDSDFLKYFCNELYEERNKMLHGRMFCGDCNKIAICIIQKIFTLDYLLSRIYDIYKENLFKSWDEGFGEEKIKYYLDLYYTKK